MIDQSLLVQWCVASLLQRIRSPLRLYKITTREDALQKAQCVESDDDGSSTERLEEKIENLQQTIKNLSIRRNELWCTTYCEEGHTKDTCSLIDHPPITIDAHRVQAQTYCNICEALTDHVVQDCPHNFKNTKWCHICETHSHKTTKCYLNARN